ncbi:MAG: lamin tail domain-containing protein, partial [Bacteroidales bacterium]|nr:lamin tail domain-containing protein [Bacteroidales bacterium]
MKKATIYCLLSIAGLFIMNWIYPQTPVFINEFHYDNAGADVNEGVEVAGPAGTDLTGWKVIFYNGNGGVLYDSVILSGTIPGQQNGFGTLWMDAPGSIQNGPDGIALVNAADALIQLISY